jgi:hypothetical protein
MGGREDRFLVCVGSGVKLERCCPDKSEPKGFSLSLLTIRGLEVSGEDPGSSEGEKRGTEGPARADIRDKRVGGCPICLKENSEAEGVCTVMGVAISIGEVKSECDDDDGRKQGGNNVTKQAGGVY